jgi:hypothetical protein
VALAGPELHVSWCRLKRAEGWEYGPVKDGEAKTHPCLVLHGELPCEQRRKDVLFGAILAALSDYRAGDPDAMTATQ